MSHPHTERENCYEIIAWGFFESYMKKVAKNRASNLKRSLFRQLKRESTQSLSEHIIPNMDQYPWENNEIKVNNRVYSVQDERIYLGLMRLSDHHLEALVLHFWEEWSDRQIAAHYNIVERTVRKWRKHSIDIIRDTVHNDGQNE